MNFVTRSSGICTKSRNLWPYLVLFVQNPVTLSNLRFVDLNMWKYPSSEALTSSEGIRYWIRIECSFLACPLDLIRRLLESEMSNNTVENAYSTHFINKCHRFSALSKIWQLTLSADKFSKEQQIFGLNQLHFFATWKWAIQPYRIRSSRRWRVKL